MRVSGYDLRQALRNPGYRVPPPGVKRSGGPNTASSLRKAIRKFHEDGADAARGSLRASLSNYFAQPGAPSTQAANARAALDTYIRLASPDPRPAFVPRSRSDVSVADDQLAADVDVVLLDPQGYAGRVLLFGPEQELTTHQLEVVAFGPVASLVAEFSADSVVGVDVWEIRRERISTVTSTNALARRDDVVELIRRVQQW